MTQAKTNQADPPRDVAAERGVGRLEPERADDGAPSVEEARRMGEQGSEAVEGERLAFEAWMRGHCWALGATWDGKQYLSDGEKGGWPDPQAMMTRRLWAAWRDRAALARSKTPKDSIDKAAMPAACPTPTGCRDHGCHGECMPPNRPVNPTARQCGSGG